MRISEKNTYPLTPASIDKISDLLIKHCTALKIERKQATRYRLVTEECLLEWMEKLPKDTNVTVSIERRMIRPYFSVEAEGEKFNPFENEDDEIGTYSTDMLGVLGVMPEYSYSNRCNRLSFQMEKPAMNPALTLLITLAAALIFGFLGKCFMPGDILSFANENVITPIYETFLRVLSCVAGPTIFFSVLWGICGISDPRSFGRVGKKLFFRYLMVVVVFALCTLAVYPFIGAPLTSSGGQGDQLKSILEMLLNIVPSNIIEPFSSGNTLQIIFLAISIGMVLILLGKRVSGITDLVFQANGVILRIMKIVSKFIPVFVFIVIVRMIWSGSLGAFAVVLEMLVAYLAISVVCFVMFILYTSVKHKVSPLIYIKKCFAGFMIGVTTASSAASLETLLATCKEKLGINEALSNFGVSIGIVEMSSFTAMYYLIVCFTFGNQFNIGSSVGWIISAVIVSIICAIAAPPIPGGCAAVYSIIFLQLGIPAEALAIVLTVDMIFDFLGTGSEMFCIMLELSNIAHDLGMENEEILRK